jgi:outer membrane protein assembly factor BamD (BamD/ComL family)
MSIDPITSSTNTNQISETQNNFQQMSKYFNQLGQTLQSGDLSGAQSAFSSLQQLLPSSSANQAQTTQQTNQSTFTTDINALGQALQSGDLSKAQDAFAKLQQDMQAAQKGHHRHHHKADNSQNSVSTSTSSSASNQTNGMQANFQQMSTYFNQLGQALQSGDLSGAQKAFASLQQLFPSSSENTNVNIVA